jgi:hypothetical protein
MRNGFVIFMLLCTLSLSAQSAIWDYAESIYYPRITDSIIRDIDGDGYDELIISAYRYGGKVVDVYKIVNKKPVQVDSIPVPYFTVFFDAGDIDNDGSFDIVFLSSDGLYYRKIRRNYNDRVPALKHIPGVTSEIVVPQPELLTDVTLVADLDGDGSNELIVENVRAIEIYETENFTMLASINLKTILEFSMTPGQFYPHYIFYTLPIILVTDLDNDNKQEIITKFPNSVNVFSMDGSLGNWVLRRRLNMGKDNIYFLSNSFIKFSFPVISDLNNDGVKEVIISSANLDMPRLRFEAIGNVYFLEKYSFNLDKGRKIVVKGIPINLPVFYNIQNETYKDLIMPVIPFSLGSVFGLLSGGGSIKVPFMLFSQDETEFNLKKPKKLFEIPFQIENITSFIEELPFDQVNPGEYPDFYYFTHIHKNKTVEITRYSWSGKRYEANLVRIMPVPRYNPQLPATLKLGNFAGDAKKEILFMTHANFYTLVR